MNDREHLDTLEQYRLAGEGTPTWLALVFTLIGILLATATAWLWITEHPHPLEHQSLNDTIHEQVVAATTQPAASPKIELMLSSSETPIVAETPVVAVEEERQLVISSELSPPPLDVLATTLAHPSDERENTLVEQVAPAPMESFPERKVCPPTITILFDLNSVSPLITDDIQIDLARLRAWMDDHPDVKLAVEGHADSTGSERYNLLLSYRRAKAVAALLEKTDIAEAQMTLFAVGVNDPLPGIATDAEVNRRVYLHVRGFESCREAFTHRER